MACPRCLPRLAAFPAIGGFEVPTGIAVAGACWRRRRRGQPFGPTNDHEIEEFIYDALDLLPGTNDVELRVEGGRVTLTGVGSAQAAQTRCRRNRVGNAGDQRCGEQPDDHGSTADARRRTRHGVASGRG